MIEVPRLRVVVERMHYPNSTTGTELIAGVDISARPGELVALVGRSGIGKTTLLRIIAGLERRFAGQVELDGKAVSKPGRAIQLVYQDFRLLPWKTVRENVAFALDDPESPEIDRWLLKMQLQHRSRAWPSELSGGEQARTALARVFVAPPSVVLLDEAFNNLDVVVKRQIQDQLISYVQALGTTMILVSHSIDDAVYLADSVYVLAGPPMHCAETFALSTTRPRKAGSVYLAGIVQSVSDALAGA